MESVCLDSEVFQTGLWDVSEAADWPLRSETLEFLQR